MVSGQTSATSSIATPIRKVIVIGEESMDSKQKAVQKANQLKTELETLFGGEFRTLCNCGYAGSFDIHKYGEPTVYISGSIYSDNYFMTVWFKDDRKFGFRNVTKARMINELNCYMKRDYQLSLF